MYHKTVVTQTAQYWHSSMHIQPWTGVESPETKSHMVSQLVFDRDDKNTQSGVTVSSINDSGKKQVSTKDYLPHDVLRSAQNRLNTYLEDQEP